MSTTQTQHKTTEQAVRTPTVRQRPAPEPIGGLSPAARTTAAAVPLPNGQPSVARAADLMTDPEQRPGVHGRARLIQTMQRSVGNARLSRMLGAPVQPKLAVGAPNDASEQEADRTADTVMRMAQPRSAAEATSMANAPVSNGRLTGLLRYARPSAPLMRAPANQAPTLGTAETTSPIAKRSPRTEMLEQLTEETKLFDNAQIIIDWVIKKTSTKASSMADSEPALYAFSATELLGNKPLVKKLRPSPTTEDELRPTLELMSYYGVVHGPIYTSLSASEPEYLLRVDPKTKRPDLSRFTAAKQSIKQFKEKFAKRQKRPSPLDPVVETSVLPLEMAAGSAAERKPEKQAEEELAKLNQELDTLDQSGADDDTAQKKRAELQAKIEKAKERLRIAGGYRTFASDVTNLLVRLRKLNTSWKAGTYPGHSWGEFSVDVFLSANLINVSDADEYSGQYWNRAAVRTFFDDLNTVAEEDDPVTGKFAWRAIYNDKPLAREINRKFGAGRVIHAINHGPAPGHKLHIHLDLRPVKLRLDPKSDYRMKEGRVELL